MEVKVEEGVGEERLAISKLTIVVITACLGRDPSNGYNLVVSSRISYILRS